MNKISKKIVALVTMAAFVLTLVPAAAFAATATTVDADASYVLTTEKNVEVNVSDPVNLELEVMNTSGNAVVSGDNEPVYLWVEDENGITTYASFTYGESNAAISNIVLDNGYGIKLGKGYDGRNDIKVSISKAGTYTIHAGVTLDKDATANSISDIKQFKTVENQNTIVVDAPENTVDSIKISTIEKADKFAETTFNKDSKPVDVDMSNLATNGLATAKVTGTAYFENNKPAANTTLELSTAGTGLNLSTDKVTTDRNGNFEFTFNMTKAANCKLYIESGELKATLNINRGEEVDLDTITTTVDNAQVLESENQNIDFSNAVQFEIVDENGNVKSGFLNDPAFTNAEKNTTPDIDYVSVDSKPSKSKLTDSDIALYWDAADEVYTLAYVGKEADKDLIDGEYTVTVGLSSGKTATASFTLAKFGEVTGMIIDVKDTVVLGDRLEGSIKYVDENGIEKDAAEVTNGKNVTLGYNGAALKTLAVGDLATNGTFALRAQSDDKYLGAKITLTAVNDDFGLISTADITVVDGVTEGSLAFDPTSGAANQKNTVNVTVVDEDGNVMDINNADLVAYVAEQSNADANIELEGSNSKVNKGKGQITIYSDKETTVDVVVAVRAADKQIYAATLEYTVGEEDINADKMVAMTIGSTDMVVDNEIVAGDAAPYVDSNWRTMVPIRALTESFGAEVEYDNDARTVTIVDGDTTIVMTIDSTTYTINGENATMDTAAVIGAGDRTYVPVRFVAEALGYKVTALQDANGLTASVVFQK